MKPPPGGFFYGKFRMENSITTASTTPGDGADTVAGAAAAIERLLSGEPEKQKRPVNVEAQSAANEAEEAQEAAAGDEAQETAAEGSEPEAEEAETSDDTAQDEADDDEQGERVFTVKVDGKELQVPESELKAGYSRHADYTRKTEALAHERRSFQSEVAQVQQERAQYAQLLSALSQQWQSSLPAAPDPKMREADPVGYMLAKDEYEEKVGRLQAAYSENQRLQQLQQEEQLKQFNAAVMTGYQKMLEAVPEWKDKSAYERDRTQMRRFLNDFGYTDEEINQASDYRMVVLARDAMKYRQLMSRKPRPDAPLEKALRPVPPVNSPAPRRAKEAQVLRKRLAESGKVEDAAAAIRSLL
jgi:hypothetical protein